jgi:acetoin utilization deacetylase AcuC-like enzyme
LKIFYTDRFVLPLPENHRFPIQKYTLLRERVTELFQSHPIELLVPHAATHGELLQAHSDDYIRRMENGSLSSLELRKLGFPWSTKLVQRSRRSSGATIEACRAAVREGISVNLAGGTHHAFADRGEGYCVFNDSAIAARQILAETRVKQVMIIDCDVHQGNGTAAILAQDSRIFTFSIHAQNNYPLRKEQSDLDIGLADAADDSHYLKSLKNGLDLAYRIFIPELVIYLAGADPYIDDAYGRLALTKNGLAERDRMVFRYFSDKGIPIAITMAGGYAKRVEDIVEIHFRTVQEALLITS